MKKILFLIIFFTLSCSPNLKSNNFNDINFSDNLSFNEFVIKLRNYVENSSYPNIDN